MITSHFYASSSLLCIAKAFSIRCLAEMKMARSFLRIARRKVLKHRSHSIEDFAPDTVICLLLSCHLLSIMLYFYELVCTTKSNVNIGENNILHCSTQSLVHVRGNDI